MSDFTSGVKSTLAAVMVAGGIGYSMVPTPPPPQPPVKCEAGPEAKATIAALTEVLKKSVEGLSEGVKACGK